MLDGGVGVIGRGDKLYLIKRARQSSLCNIFGGISVHCFRLTDFDVV